ncbi:putative polysaccharide biosynthesis protein [Bacillus marinisedimentorum]|uniref:putative polysaccharide biosynthesis protein n=1 Tax=Bacillus marinisedimentorum TaxID=1821260 RepID=UPI000873459C|nr:polysaccharide biosynthesis protein [Bacillus marinisedimentorum]
MNPDQKLRQRTGIWRGAAILTAAGLLAKILSAAYRIPYQNITGDIGFYIYQQVYPLYGIALAFALYGFPAVLSKLVAEENEKTGGEGLPGLIIRAFAFLFGFGMLLFVALYAGAGPLARWMGDPQLELPVRTVAFAFFFMPFLAVYRGYYQGHGNMVPTAVSQVTEQAVRVSTILLFAYLLISSGYGVYIAGAGAVFGSVTGGFAALLFLILFRLKKGKQPLLIMSSARLRKKPAEKKAYLLKGLLLNGLLLSMSHLLLVLLQFADSMTLVKGLLYAGVDGLTAKEMKGVYDRGFPLIQLATVFATSLSLALVPFVSSASAKGKMGEVKEKTELALRVGLMIGAGAAAGLWLILEPVNIMLFENNAGEMTLKMLSLAIIFSTAAITLSSVLQGLGHFYIPAASAAAGFLIKWAGNMIFVPRFGTEGAAAATVIAFLLIAFINAVFIIIFLKSRLVAPASLLKISGAVAGMAAVLAILNGMFGYLDIITAAGRAGAAVQALFETAAGGLVFLLIIMRIGLFSEEELELLPGGGRLAAIHQNMQRWGK